MKVGSRGVWTALALWLAWMTGGCGAAWGDMTLLMEDPVNLVGRVTSAGHAAVLLDRLCSDDHMQMRRCGPEEAGSVVSRYPHLAHDMDWLAMPPGAFLFGVDAPDEILGKMSGAAFQRMQVEYRLAHEDSFPQDPGPQGWEQLTGEAYRRRIIAIRVHTTPEQDEQVMRWLNQRENVSHFNIFTSNCADFVADLVNVAFPGAVRRNYLFDSGMMTPKQVEYRLHKYARKHPELGWEVSVVRQVPGMKRSHRMYGVTEAYLKTWWFMLPFDVMLPYELGAVTTLGLCDRRYEARKGQVVDTASFFPRVETAGLEQMGGR